MIESKIGLIKFMKRYSKIVPGKKDPKMKINLVYGPEDFLTKVKVAE